MRWTVASQSAADLLLPSGRSALWQAEHFASKVFLVSRNATT